MTTRPPGRHRLAESARTFSERARHARHRYGADLHRYTEARLTEAEADAADDWPYFLGWSVAGGAALIGATHLVEWLTLRSENELVRLLGVGLGMLVGGSGIALLAWIYWRIQLDPEDKKPYVVAMLTSLATVGACVVAYAGLTTLLWQGGAITSDLMGGPAGLLKVEAYYLWHLVDTVPLIGATKALHWESPLVFSDPWSGSLLLTFKVLLLIPLIRVLLSGFRLVSSSWLSHAQGRARGRQTRESTIELRAVARSLHPGVRVLVIIAEGLGGLVLLIGLPLFAYGVLTFVVRRSSYTDRWMGMHLPRHVDFLGMTPSTWWLHVAVAVAGAWLVLAMAWGLADEIFTEYEVYLESERGSRLRTAAAVLFPCWLMLLATLGAVAVTLILIRAGLAGADPQPAPSREVNATIEWYAWQLADTIPLLDISNTLHWTTDVQFLDPWTGAVLVLMRLVLISVLLVPFSLLLRTGLQRARRRRRAPQIQVIERFARRFEDASAGLDRVERTIFAPNDDAARPGIQGDYLNFRQAARAAGELENELEPLMALLGDGPVIEAARAAIAALKDRVASVADARDGLWRMRSPAPLWGVGSRTSSWGRPRTADYVQKLEQSLSKSRLAAAAEHDRYVRLATLELLRGDHSNHK